jgi:hypothetical protein
MSELGPLNGAGNARGHPGGLTSLARRLGAGRLLYYSFYAPASFLRRCRRDGCVNLALSRQGRNRMRAGAARLPAAGPPAAGAPDVHFLSGRAFWYQTIFCAFSLARHCPAGIRPVVYDDGTLDDDAVRSIRRVLPHAQVVPRALIEERLDRTLPAARFPALRQRRLSYPHLRKLTDVHAGCAGWKLVLDSDMLFFREPAFLLGWLAAPQRPCHMLDVANAYGYPEDLMAELAGHPIPERVNVGICGLRSDDIDWDRLESWCKGLLERAGMSYLHEQALTAMLLAGRECAVAPAGDYVALPPRHETVRPTAVMHHYVAESKAWYYRYAWRHVLPA